jgi:hypothetical protein
MTNRSIEHPVFTLLDIGNTLTKHRLIFGVGERAERTSLREEEWQFH